MIGRVAIAACLALVACGEKQDKATQVAARVNGKEITIHQINYLLSRNKGIAPDASETAKREILDKLVAQELLLQKVESQKLDKTVFGVQAVEAAKREALVRVYMDQIMAEHSLQPSRGEVHDYFTSHPELFAERRAFDLEEFAIAGGADLRTSLEDFLKAGRNGQEVAEWLRARSVEFASTRGVRVAEQISLEQLPGLQAMKPGEMKLFETGDTRLRLVRLIGYTRQPVDEEAATPKIRQFLYTRRANERVAGEMKRLKEEAKVEYVGEFAGAAASPKQ
jgi:EpsD family peptidyl-prolyl cis-trans isomerase